MAVEKTKSYAPPDVANELFGGRVFGSGAGYLTAIEFFGLLGAAFSHNKKILADDELMEVQLNSADFARRYAWPPKKAGDAELKLTEATDVFSGGLEDFQNENHEPLVQLIRSLAIPKKPNVSAGRDWTTARFYPYSKELMHWDIRRKKGVRNEVQTERNDIRGAGALAHKILRGDNDSARLKRIQEGFKEILDPTLATDQLFSRLNKGNNCEAGHIFKDEIEQKSKTIGLESEGILCRSVDNILTNKNLDKFTKVNHLMHIIPLAVMCHALRAARHYLDDRGKFYTSVVDFGYSRTQLRDKSNSQLGEAANDIKLAISKKCEDMFPDPEERRGAVNVALGQRNWGNYYILTGAAIGFLNAASGKRFHTLKDNLILALVAAELGSNEKEITLKDFCGRLFDNWGMVIDHHALRHMDWSDDLSATAFKRNAQEHFANRLRHLGILREFSDSTVMVGLPS